MNMRTDETKLKTNTMANRGIDRKRVQTSDYCAADYIGTLLNSTRFVLNAFL